MHLLAQKYRQAQFFAHAAHNLVKGTAFFADHEYLGSLYTSYEEAYDALIERMIGLDDENADPLKVTKDAAVAAEKLLVGKSVDAFSELLDMEREICDMVRDQLKEIPSAGTANLLQGLADASEARQYKISQRIS